MSVTGVGVALSQIDNFDVGMLLLVEAEVSVLPVFSGAEVADANACPSIFALANTDALRQ